jgi:hypothetical protein
VAASAEFDTTLQGFGSNTGIEVPDDVVAQLGAGRRPPVHVVVNGHEFRSTVAVMGGKNLIAVSAATRRETGLAAGDALHVVLTLAVTPREVVVPDDLAGALAAEPECAAFFAGLSNSLQRYHVDTITGTTNPETRQRRIDRALASFRAGRKR